jgi:cellulose synthase (UDP-forming)
MYSIHKEKRRATMRVVRDTMAIAIGLIALFAYIAWWITRGLAYSGWLLIPFVAALTYTLVQMIGNWLLYLAAHRSARTVPPVETALSVDVFVTACGEEPALVERALQAACHMYGQHETWLLDDNSDFRLEQIANRLGAGYLTRTGNGNAKAGNLNAALARTDGDIIVIFDVDHAPEPEFLLRSLPYFSDPDIGFVQVMLTFDNDGDGWVAQAASESSMDFYNPTSVGADRIDSATLIGSNALIRRTALVSIDGYQPGLAEDLATSVALHAAGWQSRYVHEPLAPGVAPPDLTAWFNQQFKWSRGVFELLVTVYPRLFGRLHLGQKISYAVRMTYYWAGVFIAAHLLAAIWVLFSADESLRQLFESYLVVFIPLMVLFTLIRQLVLAEWQHKTVRTSLQVKPFVLVFNTWPIYTLSWMMALVRLPLGFRPTPKAKADRFNYWWLAPQIVTVLLLLAGLSSSILRPITLLPLTTIFTVTMIVLHSMLFGLVVQPSDAPQSTTAHPHMVERTTVPNRALYDVSQIPSNADRDY